MEELLTPVRTSRARKNPGPEGHAPGTRPAFAIKNVLNVVEALGHQPTLDEFKQCLVFLYEDEARLGAFKIPSPSTTQTINLLVNDVLPNYWSQIHDDWSHTDISRRIACILRCLPGLGAVVHRLGTLSSKQNHKIVGSDYLKKHIRCMIQVLELILQNDRVIVSMWNDITNTSETAVKKTLYWSQFVSVLATGKVISAVSQAEDVVKLLDAQSSMSWLATGKMYNSWLASNIAVLATSLESNSGQGFKDCSTILVRALSLGYANDFILTFMQKLLRQSPTPLNIVLSLFGQMRKPEQRTTFKCVLRLLSSQIPATKRLAISDSTREPIVKNLAAFLKSLVVDNDTLADCLMDYLLELGQAAGLGDQVLHASISALATDAARTDIIFTKIFDLFANEIVIKHAPILQQEVLVQILLLISGAVHKKAPSRLATIAKSSSYMNSISDHLKANSTRIRWLGMIVGSTISNLVDKEDLKMCFKDESLTTDEAEWYFGLIRSLPKPAKEARLDKFFPAEDIRTKIDSLPTTRLVWIDRASVSQSSEMSRPPTIVGRKIEQIENEDEELVPYSKPDSDPEDDEKDPTLVNRNKPKTPVYIRDLMIGLRETNDYEKHLIALKTAPLLIRQKSGFGREIIDHIQELAGVLMNLNDVFGLEDFLHLREEALIALLLADGPTMAQYYAKAALEGDFSLQQRSAILTAIGLGARELAGYKDEERTLTLQFPSRRLPAHLEEIYKENVSVPLLSITSDIQQEIVQPLALKAVDDLTGPTALKVRTFSSRIAKEKTKKKPAANLLATMVADNFFFPLTGRYWTCIQVHGARASFLHTHLLPLYLRSLAVIMHAAGPWAVSLPQMTSEFWTILLAIRSASLADNKYAILQALLFSFLIILQTNENKERLAREQANELLETQEWTRLVLEKVDPGTDEGDGVRGLAASVLVRCQEVVDKWQRLMVGDLLRY